MRFLIGLVLIVALGWGGYWFIGSRAAESGLRDWLDAHVESGGAGWRADYADLGIRGFPNRFDITIVGPQLEVPQRGFAWRAPFLQVLALSYRPNHQIIVWPREQELTLFGADLALKNDDMRASLVLRPDTSLALDRLVLTLDRPVLRDAAGGWQLDAAEARFATRPSAAREGARDLAVEITGIAASEWLRATLGAGALPDGPAEALRLDLTAWLDAPIDRRALSGAPPRVTAVEVNSASLRWGGLSLDAAGTIRIDAAGRPEGELTVESGDWAAVFAAAEAAGLVAAEAAAALAVLAAGAGALPLTLADGAVSLGPVALGPLPGLAQRQ